MFGYACDETDVQMPLPISLAHRLMEHLAELRKTKKLNFLRPDAKSQVTVRYSDNQPVAVRPNKGVLRLRIASIDDRERKVKEVLQLVFPVANQSSRGHN